MSELKLNGLDALEVALKRKARNVSKKALSTVVRMNASELQQNAMRNAPCQTGALRRSITMKLENTGLVAIIQPYMDYAPYVEYGTRFMLAKPFIRPAYQQQAEKFKSDLKRLLGS